MIQENKKAKMYRIVTPEFTCVYGTESIDLLKKHGYEVEDIHLKTIEEAEEYKKKNGYNDTPRIFLDGEYIGNDDDLVEYFNK